MSAVAPRSRECARTVLPLGQGEAVSRDRPVHNDGRDVRRDEVSVMQQQADDRAGGARPNEPQAGAKHAVLGFLGLMTVVLLGTGAPAHAQSMPDSLRMSCAATAALVRERGAVVIGTGPGIFDRYVSTQGYCAPGQTTEPIWLQTADQKQCFIGYRCRDRLPRLR